MTLKKNKKSIRLILILICSLLFFANTPNRKPKTSDLRSGSDDFYLLPQEASNLIKKNQAVLVDIREWDEVKLGMAASARWMPLSRMNDLDMAFTWFLSELPKEKLIIFYCGLDCKGSFEAQKELQLLGYQTANMGDYSNWANVGFPITIPLDQSRTLNRK